MVLYKWYYYYYFLVPTSTKPQAEILKLNNVNGCNNISFFDHKINSPALWNAEAAIIIIVVVVVVVVVIVRLLMHVESFTK